jgi:hypothetical protein
VDDPTFRVISDEIKGIIDRLLLEKTCGEMSRGNFEGMYDENS